MSQNHPLFPVGLATLWQDAACFQLDETLLAWLLEPGSLTEKLKKSCQFFRVELLGQRIEPCQPQEANDIIAVGEQVLVREVLLYCDEQPHVFARSLLPLASLTGEEQALARLGTQSLGQVLFNNPSLKRHGFEISSFVPGSNVAALVQSLSIPAHGSLWGRRSVFFVHDKPLMVAEVFLPNAEAYQYELIE